MSWVFYKDINFADKRIQQYHVDTRDFCVSTNTNPPKVRLNQMRLSENEQDYYHTDKEIRDLLDRYFKESGGRVKWRMLMLEGEGAAKTSSWQLKYMLIYRLPKGLIVAYHRNEVDIAYVYSKQILACPVNKAYLNAH